MDIIFLVAFILFSVIAAYACLSVTPPDDTDDMNNEVDSHENLR